MKLDRFLFPHIHHEMASRVRKTLYRARLLDLALVAVLSGIGCYAMVRAFNVDPYWVGAGWAGLLAVLALLLRVLPARVLTGSVQHIVDSALSAKEAELTSLRLVHGVSQALPEPLFILDAQGMVEHANPAAKELVGFKAVEGRHFAAVLRAPSVYEAAEQVISTGAPQTVEFSTAGSVERFCRAFVAPFSDDAGDQKRHQRSIVFIRDLTSEKRVDQMRADFIASASHELRTPLASLLGFIETMNGPAQDDPEAQKKFLKIMESQAQRMQRLVADLMSLSRIELNEHVAPSDHVDVREITQDVIASLGPILESKGAIVDLVGEHDTDAFIKGDRDEIFQAVQNLLDNAVKYGGTPAMVKVCVGRGIAPPVGSEGNPSHRAGDSAIQVASRLKVKPESLVHVQVRDFGPGIERSDLPRLTERFYRVSVERSLKTGGTGLGLAIVKHIVNRHKGGFQIESGLAAGAAFTCYFLAEPESANTL